LEKSLFFVPDGQKATFFLNAIFKKNKYHIVMKKTIIRLSVILLFLSGFFFSCKKEIRSSIPNAEVYIETSPSEFAKLRNPNSAVSYIPGDLRPINFRFGFGGVLIFRDLDGRVRSCDLACPVEASRTIRVEVKMPYAVCPVCHSEFDLSWGFASPKSGPAKEPLRLYNNVFERATSIVVSN
jgi:nitrite reductase/ring-hydroxylating ferredoxin subunit